MATSFNRQRILKRIAISSKTACVQKERIQTNKKEKENVNNFL